MKIDLQKGAKQIGYALGKAAEIGKRAADSTMTGVQTLAEKAQKENEKAQLKKYNPVFPEDYQADGFGLPNLVVIVDDAVRKDVEVCRGAIGWKGQVKGVEMLYLYDEAIAFSGLHFIPAPTCDCVYHVDAHDRNRFIRMDCFFDKMQESRLAELQHIAFTLGAKKYSVEMYDVTSETRSGAETAALKGSGLKRTRGSASEERTQSIERKSKRESVACAEFAGDRTPTRPDLHWFAHDDNILNLIEMRCSGGNSGVKNYSIELKGSDSAAMAASAAAKLDAAIGKMGMNSGFSLESRAVEESHHRLCFQLEF